MSKVVGDIAVTVGADVSGLLSGMDRAGRSVKGFDRRAGDLAKRMAKLGAAVSVASIGMGVAAFNIARSAADAGAQIENLSRIANASPVQFQKMAAAAETVGVSQEKLADILKDVQDRVGDFLATGGGPMADFFEKIAPKVGVTADQFARLSGPEALQLFYRSLQDANLSQSEMTFYLEAMSSDLTALQPLLANNGEGIRRIGDEAERSGRILSNEAVNGASDLRSELDTLTDGIRNQFLTAILENKDEIINLTNEITETWIPALIKVLEFINNVVRGLEKLQTAYINTRRTIQPGFGMEEFNIPSGDVGITSPSVDQFRSGDSGSGSSILDQTGEMMGLGGDTNLDGGSGSDTFGTVIPGSGSSSSGGGDAMQHSLDMLRDYYEQRAEVIQGYYGQELEAANAFTDQMESMEANSFDARLSKMRTIFGEMSGLMRSENEKLFKIGKAAAVANAVVNGYSAAVAAWEKGMQAGGPPLAAAFTAASLARTGALISSIQSQSASGGSGGGGASAATAGSAETGTSQRVALTLNGTTFSRDQVIELINNINEAVEDGAIVRVTS